MRRAQTFALFLYKQLMVLRFHAKSLVVILTACFGLQVLMLHFAHQPVRPLEAFTSPTEAETLFQGCFFDVAQTFYAPDTPEVTDFLKQMCGSALDIRGFSHAETMIKALEECKANCAGVHFRFPDDNEDVNRRTLDYTIYTNRMKLPPDQRYVTDSLDASFSQTRDYVHFIKLQHSINLEYIMQRIQKQPEVSVKLQSMPYMRGGFFQNEAGILFGVLFPVFFVVLLESTFFVPLVEEKQDGLKEFLVIATPSSYLNGLAFYLVRLVLYVLYSIFVLNAASRYNALGIVPMAYAFLLVVLFILSVMSYAYLISLFFNTVFYAKTVGYIMLILPMAFQFISSSVGKVDVYCFSMNAFIEAWKSFQIFGNKYNRFAFTDLFTPITASSFSICQIYLILLVQTAAYSMLYAYLVHIFPGPGGVRKPLTFFLQRHHWRAPQYNHECVSSAECADAIIIQDLQKEFKTSGRSVVVADRLNMAIKNKQITVLLGHNGAGKTTTINMIMGMVPKDDGKIVVCSESDANCYRHLIGYCPQNSIYMQYMTCRQHLIFFAKLRGLDNVEATALSKKLLQQLNLESKADEYGKNLSGGMKRRLSLGIAIAGHTRIVILDEPSSGLDIQSRRELWDILLELRKTKAVLITTHHMEEAEVLGDTISILGNGRLQLSGSPLELKRKIGSGYVLKLCTNEGKFNMEDCLLVIRDYVPTARVLNVVQPTIAISIPYEYRQKYSAMLATLERQQTALGINTISVTDTTLEDVFLNSASKSFGDEIDGPVNSHNVDTSIRVPYQRLDSLKIDLWQQFLAIIYKKLLFVRNEWILTTVLTSFPFLMATIAIIIIHSSTLLQFGSGLQLSLDHYEHGIVYQVLPENPTAEVERFAQQLRNRIEHSSRLHVKQLALNTSANIDEELVGLMKDDFYEFQQNVVGTLQLDGDAVPSVTVLYSENMMHSSAILTDLVDNVIYQYYSGIDETILRTVYAPVSVRNTSAASLRLGYYAALVSMGMFMLMFFFAMLPFKENRSGFKRLHALSRHVYWISTLIGDVLLLCFICALLFAYQALIMPRELYSLGELFGVVSSLFFYGVTYLPLLYCFSNIVTTMSGLSTCMATLYYVSFVPTVILSGSIADMLKYEKYIIFLRLLPDFNLGHQLRVVNERFINSRATHIPQALRDELNSKSVLSLSNFYFYVLLVAVSFMVLFLYVIENNRRRQKCMDACNIASWKCKPSPSSKVVEEDSFIQEEKSTVDKVVRDGIESQYPLVVHNVCKSYNRKMAVCDLNFVVHKRECFGLLGVNGAGKTTTFEMIATNQPVTSGTIKIDGVDIEQQEADYRYRFGYCPQNDCLNDFMTAYQTLRYMALLRGVISQQVHEEVMYWLEQLDLEDFRDVQVKHYSGGTKRKLQTATAMIGSPSLVLLDEPTSGVDPVSRRFLWQSIQDFQKRDKTLVLTSHSMDECEHLCNRLAIMAEGQFKCLGHVPELRQMHGAGFTISVKLRADEATDDEVSDVTSRLRRRFCDCTLRENHAGILTYFVPSSVVIGWSAVFAKCEAFLGEAAGIVEEYSVNETTLEDIFLKQDSKHNSRRSRRGSSNRGSISLEVVSAEDV